jgi:XTP/dITP diphosphohydrolase
MTPTVVLASRNTKKVAELRRILRECGLAADVVGSEAYADLPEIPESGETFLANSTAKATAVARHTGFIAVADDSGLAVDALNGMPGVLSARWAGTGACDDDNLDLVLQQTADVPDERRGAAFHCAATAARIRPDGAVDLLIAEADVRGRLLRHRRGSGGFGYDPVFLPDGFDRTTAEMSSADKDRISHRGKAFRVLAAQLGDWLADA